MFLLNISIIIKLLFIFLVIFVFLPRRVFKPSKEDSFLDTFFINLTHMVFITILLVPFLIIIGGMYELFTLVLSYLLIFISPFIYNIFKDRDLNLVKDKIWHYQTTMINYILNVFDSLINPFEQIKEYIAQKFVILRERLKKIDKTTMVYILFFISIFGYAAYLRLYDSFHHLTLGTADPYVVTVIVKELEMNKFYTGSIYPESHAVILSVFHLLSFLDIVHIFRFFGPLMALVLVLSVYYVTLKVTSNKWAALIPTFIYGTFTTDQLPVGFNRQCTTLGQEFGMIFLLPCLFFLLQYLSTQKRRYLVFFFETLVIIFKLHSLVAIIAFLGVVAIFITGLMNRLWNKKVFFRVLLSGLVAVVLGHLTLVIYLFMGNISNKETIMAMMPLFDPQTTSPELTPLLWGISFAALFILGYGIFFCRSKKEKIGYLFLSIFYLIVLIEYQANYFHLRHLVHPARASQFVALIAAVITGPFFHLITLKGLITRPLFHKGFYPVITLSTLLVLGMFFPAKPPITFKMGYDAFMTNYLRISKEYPPLQWLIVSQVEEYPLALYKGWHLNTTNFLDTYNPFKEELPIDTPNIFFFVEKKIFKITVARTQKDYDWRWDQMRRLDEWCKIYMVYHNDMSIFYEDDNIIIYAIHK